MKARMPCSILRFWNDDVLRDIEGVCQHIVTAACRGGPEISFGAMLTDAAGYPEDLHQ